jgi:hypothetical protein
MMATIKYYGACVNKITIDFAEPSIFAYNFMWLGNVSSKPPIYDASAIVTVPVFSQPGYTSR